MIDGQVRVRGCLRNRSDLKDQLTPAGGEKVDLLMISVKIRSDYGFAAVLGHFWSFWNFQKILTFARQNGQNVFRRPSEVILSRFWNFDFFSKF